MKPNSSTSTSFTLGPGSSRTQTRSHQAGISSSSTTAAAEMSSMNSKPSLELPQIPTSSFMDSFGSSEIGQGGMGLDMPLLPLGSSSTSTLTGNDGRVARIEKGGLGSGSGGSSTAGPRPRVLSAREVNPNSTTTATSFDTSTGHSSSFFSASSSTTTQADPTSRALNGQRAGSPRASRSYRSDGRTGLGVAATPTGPSMTTKRSPLKTNPDRPSKSSAMGATGSTDSGTGSGLTASASTRRPPPERLDLESPGRGGYYRSSTTVVGGREMGERRRVVTEPGQGVSLKLFFLLFDSVGWIARLTPGSRLLTLYDSPCSTPVTLISFTRGKIDTPTPRLRQRRARRRPLTEVLHIYPIVHLYRSRRLGLELRGMEERVVVELGARRWMRIQCCRRSRGV